MPKTKWSIGNCSYAWLTKRIVDLVSTGNTLKENGLAEVEKIMDVSSYLIVNRNISNQNQKK